MQRAIERQRDIRRRRNQRTEELPSNPVVSALQSHILHGVHSTRRINIEVKSSSRVHHRALVGDAITIDITPSSPSPNFAQFIHSIWNVYRTIGRNAIAEFGRFVYTLQLSITAEKPLRHRDERFEHDLILFPCEHGRVADDTQDDFEEEDYNQQLFTDTFGLWANRHGSGIRLISINAVQLQMVRAPVAAAAVAGTWFEVPFTKQCCVNVKNEDNGCFQWALLSALRYNAVAEESRSVVESYYPFIDNYQWDGIVYTDKGADFRQACTVFEEINPFMSTGDSPLAINVWKRRRNDAGIFEAFPVHVSKNYKKPDAFNIDLFYAEDEESDKCHYLFIRDLSAFVRYKKGHWEELCRCCLKQFKYKNQLLDHYEKGCYPPSSELEIHMPGKNDRVGYGTGNEETSIYVIAHALSTKNSANELKIGEIAYKIYTHQYTLPDGIESQYKFESVHDFIDLMIHVQERWSAWKKSSNYKFKYHRFSIIVSETKTLHQILTALDDYEIDLCEQIGTIDDTNLTCLRIGDLNFTDSSRFFKTELVGDAVKGVDQLFNKWTEFRAFGMNNYKLDPALYYTLPALAWNAAMKFTQAKPEYITDREIYQFIERAKRGALNHIPNRLHQANNPLLGDVYDPTKETTYLANFDIKSSYGCSMKQHLPYGDYKRISDCSSFTRSSILTLADDADTGYFFEVTLSVPPNVHWQDRHSDLPFAPCHRIVNGRKMLVLDFDKKERYVVHYRLLKYYLRKQMVLEQIHSAVSFTQKQWLKPFMELQEQLRNEASKEMDSVVKLITNSVFGKSCTNPRNGALTRLFRVDTVKGRIAFNRYGLDERTTMVRKITPNILSSSRTKQTIKLDQYIAVGTTILELGKLQLYEWYYDKLIPRTVGMKLLYCDTDSLIVKMNSDPAEVMKQYPEYFNGAVGSLKEESNGVPSLFIGSKPKHYLYQSSEKNKVCIAGLTKEASSMLTAATFTDVLENNTNPTAAMQITYTKNHHVTVNEQLRHYLDDIDHGRVYLDQYTSVPFGYIGLK
jgi:hypothetical protein